MKGNLTNEELAIMAMNNGREALEQLIRQNEGLVIIMAYGFLTFAGYSDCISTGLVEDYKQVCRLSIVRAVKNFNPDSGIKFMTYACRIMRNDMLENIGKENEYRHNVDIVENPNGGSDVPEWEEEYADYDDYEYGFENEKNHNRDFGFEYYFSPELTEDNESVQERIVAEVIDAKAAKRNASRLRAYKSILRGIERAATEGEGTEPDEEKDARNGKKHEIIAPKAGRNYSQEDLVYNQAMKNIRIEAMLKGLLSDWINPNSREILVYRYGLIDSEYKSITRTREHFNLSATEFKRQESIGLWTLKIWLQHLKWI